MTTGSSFFGNKGEREWEEGEEKIKVEGKREGKREEGERARKNILLLYKCHQNTIIFSLLMFLYN